MSKVNYEKNTQDWVIENDWRWECRPMRIGVGALSVPWPIAFCVIGAPIANFFIYLGVVLLVIDLIERLTGVSPKGYARALRSNRSFWLTPKVMMYHLKVKSGKEPESADYPDYINQMGVLHGHVKWKKRSLIQSLALVFIVGYSATPATLNAQTYLVLPKKKEQESKVERNIPVIPTINNEHIIVGYGVDVPLKSVMAQIVPETFDVRIRHAELKEMPISWRSQDLSSVELFYDLAERYNILFRYSNRSGIVYVEWAGDNCNARMDTANVYQIIC